ncbi:hypothetical protein BH10BDE1_BH10BDE1_21700 [soil metagenome]
MQISGPKIRLSGATGEACRAGNGTPGAEPDEEGLYGPTQGVSP